MSTNPKGQVGRVAASTGLIIAGAVSGAVLVGSLTANAASPSPSPSSSSSSWAVDPSTGTPGGPPAHGSAAHEGQEKAVTGTDASKAQAAAVKAAGGGTAGAVTSDFTGSGYEVTVTKADGSTQEVHLNSSYGVENPGR